MPARDAADYEALVGDVHDLRAFALASDLRSLTAAARHLGESVATISRRITRLEGALEVTLLRRSPRAVEPTDDGIAYRARVGEVLELLADANATAQRAHAAPSGHLRITTAPGLDDVVAPIISAFSAKFPDVRVSVLVSERFVDLETEHVDVALRATTKLADSSLVAHRLTELERIAVASPAYLRAHPAPRRPEDLAQHRIVQLGETRVVPVVLRRSDGSDAVEVRLTASMGANSVAFARALVVAGGGIAVLPQLGLRQDLGDGRLVRVLPHHSMREASLYLLHGGGRFLPPKVRAFREIALDAFAAPKRRSRTR